MLWSNILSFSDFKNQLEKLSRDELNALDSEGYSLLSYSLVNKDVVFVEYLLKDLNLDPKVKAYSGLMLIKMNVKESKQSPLWRSAIRGSEAERKLALLKQHGSNLDELDDSSFSLLSYLLWNQDTDLDLLEFVLNNLNLNLKQHAYSGNHYFANGVPEADKTTLWKAALGSFSNINQKIRLLQKYGVDLEEVDANGMSALTWCLYYSKPIYQLLPYVDVNKKAYAFPDTIRDSNVQKFSPLDIAVVKGYGYAAKALIEFGARSSYNDVYNNSLLHVAIGKPEIFQLIRDQGVDVNAVNAMGFTPLGMSILRREHNAAEKLVSLGADVNVAAKLPLFNLSVFHLLAFKLIIIALDGEESDDKEDNDEDEETSIQYREILSLLGEFKSPENMSYSIFFDDIRKYFVEILRFIGKALGGDLDLPDNISQHRAFRDDVGIAESVFSIFMDYIGIRNDCLHNDCNKINMPTVFYAVMQGDCALLIKLLKDNPHTINIIYKGFSLIRLSAMLGHKHCLDHLLKHPCLDINAIDEQRNNVLAYIAPFQDIEIVQKVIDRGVDIDTLNKKFISAADKVLYHFRKSKDFDKAWNLISQYSKDQMHALIAKGKKYKDHQFDFSKINVGIAVAKGFWSTDHFSMARKIMKEQIGLNMLIVTKDHESEDFLSQFNAFVVPGGEDSFPKNQEFVISDLDNAKLRNGEKLYKRLLSVADKYNIPTMGMCLGNQYVGLFNGATLDTVKGHNGGDHKGIFNAGTLSHFMALSQVEQHQLLESQYYPSVEFDIDTFHNFAIVQNKPGRLNIGAYSEAGVVQAVSYRTNFLSFQFHPENYYGSDFDVQGVRSTNLINNFMSLAKQHAQYHNFADRNGFSYEEAQAALRYSNNAVLDVIKNGALAQCRVLDKNSMAWKVENLVQSNVTYSKFDWPSPSFESFPQGECRITSNVCKEVAHNGSEQSFAVAVYVPADYGLGGHTICSIGDQA